MINDGTVRASDITISDLENVAAKSNILVSKLMCEAYQAVGDPDGIYGCGADDSGSNVARSVTAVYSCQSWRHSLCIVWTLHGDVCHNLTVLSY